MGIFMFTADANERRVHLSEGGWNDEQIAWYATPVPDPSDFDWDYYARQ